jgi:hypothetical protein
VAGDVDVRAGRVELGPQAAIGGRLRYASPEELVRDPAAQVRGGVEPIAETRSRGGAMPHAFGGLWTAGLMVLAAVLAIMLLVTIIGIPLALLTLLAYPILLLIAYVSVAVVAGRMAVSRWKPDRAEDKRWQAGAAAASMLAIGVIASVPWIGALVVLAVLFVGLGSLFLTVRAAW